MRKGLFSRFAKVGGAVAIVCAVLLLAVNVLAASDWVETRVATWIKKQSGRDLDVNGSTRLTFLPAPYIEITDAVLNVPNPGSGTAEFTVAKLGIYLGFSDLFGGGTSAERIVLEQPVLTLHLGDERQALVPEGAIEPLETLRFAKAQMAGGGPSPHDVRIEELRIKNGTVVFSYAGAPPGRRIKHINAEVSLPSLAAPLKGRGTFDWKKEPVDFRFEVATPADLRAMRPASLKVALDATSAAGRFNGNVSATPDIAGRGTLSVQAHSIPKLTAWLRGATITAPTIGDGELDSAIEWTSQKIMFSKMKFALEHARGEGEAVVTLARPRPHIRGAFALDYLDLNPFLEASKKDARASVHAVQFEHRVSTAKSAGQADWFSPPASPAAEVEQAVVPPPAPPVQHAEQAALSLSKPAPGVAQPSLTISMPQAAIDRVLAQDMPLQAAPAPFDADVNLNLRKTRVGHLNIGPSSLGLAFNDGTLKATLWGMALYDGEARGTLTVDIMKPVPSFSGDIRLDGVDSRPLLMDAAQFGMIAGKSRLTLTVSGEGADAEAIKSSLTGNGAFVVTDGAIEGMDVPALINGLGEGRLVFRQGPEAKTAFGTLAASFNINEGIARTRNLRLRSQALQVNAKGAVDLPRETLDILATANIVAGAAAGGGRNALAGLSVPVRIEGPLDSPRIRPEIGAMFADTNSTGTVANKIGAALRKKFGGKPVSELIGGLFGGSATAGTNPEEAQPQALAPSLSVAPEDGDAGVPMRTEPRR